MNNLNQYQLSTSGIKNSIPILNDNLGLTNLSNVPNAATNVNNHLINVPQTSLSNNLNNFFNSNPAITYNANSLLNSTHNTLGRRHGNLPTLNLHATNNLISNYATISRAAANNQLNGHLINPLNNNLNNYQQMTQFNQLPTNHLANGNLMTTGNNVYENAHYLQQQFQPQFAGLEVGLELVENDHCFCCLNKICKKRCNIARVIAFICAIVVLFLMSLCISSSNWLTTDNYRQGLWEFCVDEGATRPLPFDLNVDDGCYPGRDAEYIRLAGLLCSFGLALDVLAITMTGFGLFTANPHKKYALYKFAIYIMIGELIVILTALVIYPAWFASEIEISNRQIWEFGWAYGVGWGASIFLFGAILLLLCDKESEDIYYRERTIVHNVTPRELKA